MNNDDFNQDQGSDSIDPVFKQKLSITMNNALNEDKSLFLSQSSVNDANDNNEKSKEKIKIREISNNSIQFKEGSGIYIGNNEIIHYSDGQVQINKKKNFYKGRRIEERINNNKYINNYINNHPDIAHGDIIFQIKTPLEQTDENWEFLLGDYNNNGILDLFCIKKKNTGSKHTEVHILDGSTHFKSFLFQIGTPLKETGDNWQFLLGDYNKNGKLDLYCIKKNDTGTNSTEVHILNGNDNFQSFLLETTTRLHETGDNFQFLLGDYNQNGILDLYCIKKNDTGTNSTEVHILNGEDNFKSFLFQTGTALPEVGDNYDFKLEDYNNYGKLDLYCIKKFGTGTNSTKINILGGNDNFQSFITNIETKLPQTDEDFSFYPFKDKLYAIHKKGDNNFTDVYCLKIQEKVPKDI